MEREKVLELVKENVTNKNLFKHCLAVEAIMRATARQLNTINENTITHGFASEHIFT